MVEYFEDGEKDVGLDDDGEVLLSGLLQILKNIVHLLLRLVKSHGLGGVLHAQVDVDVVELVELGVPLAEGLKRYARALLLLPLLHLAYTIYNRLSYSPIGTF